jgi:hypothetical protein
MVLGLPVTSLPVQNWVEQPLTVIVPVKVPAPDGWAGVMVIWPVVGPVSANEWLKPVPDWEVTMNMAPLVALMVTVCAAGAVPPCVADNEIELAEMEKASPEEPPPPPPPQPDSATVPTSSTPRRKRMLER